MYKIYHLSSCNTCQRILSELPSEKFEIQNIKENHIDEKTLDQLAKEYGSYEALFNKRAIKYREQKLKDQNLSDLDFKKLILEEYTFLKRPIIILNDKTFVGNSKKTIAALRQALAEEINS